MVKLIKKIVKEDNFLSLAGNLMIAALGLGGFALLTRSLTSNDFAQWVIFISGGSLIEMLRFGITNNALVRFLSGATKEESEKLIGSNAFISLWSTIGLSIVMVVINFVFQDAIQNSIYSLFFTWYPLLALVNLPWNNALIVLQAKMKYATILWIKTLNSGSFFLVLVVNIVFLNLSVTQLLWILIFINFITSFWCVIKKWDGLFLIKKATKSTNKTLFNFGKYSTFTLIGTNLLRNADLLIISISPLGSEAVALFSIPLKLTELQQIPLRSFAATAFPKMSKASVEGKIKELQNILYTYTGALTYLFIAISILTFVFAELFVIVISGHQYLNTVNADFDIVALVRIFSIYGLLLPIDRMTGIALDSMNKPQINALKVMLMLGTNIIGDMIALFVFQSLELVAISTLLFTAVGIFVGTYFVKQQIEFSAKEIFKSGSTFYKEIWNQLLVKRKDVTFLKN